MGEKLSIPINSAPFWKIRLKSPVKIHIRKQSLRILVSYDHHFFCYWEERFPINNGCFVLSHSECCLYYDNRNWNNIKNQPCVPTNNENTNYVSGNVCEPKSWVDTTDSSKKGSCENSEIVCNGPQICFFFGCNQCIHSYGPSPVSLPPENSNPNFTQKQFNLPGL